MVLNKLWYFWYLICLITPLYGYGQLSQETISTITNEVNDLRSTGVTCGKEYIPAVGKMTWRADLYKVSEDYAIYMHDNNHFGHLSLEGQDAGDRVDSIGYDWRYVGENLASGQRDFYEVLADWIKSESHCKMLMNPNMEHFAVARYKNYWVQTFATLQKGNRTTQ